MKNNAINYATMFQNALAQKYSRELLTAPLTTQNITFMGGRTIHAPYIDLRGFKNHDRSGAFNRQDVNQYYDTFTMEHDRDVEFYIDSMDVEEANISLTATNITNTFESDHAIPEVDAYRISKIYKDLLSISGMSNIGLDVITQSNVLGIYEDLMERLDNAEVPQDGRVLFVTSRINTLIRKALDHDRLHVANEDGAVNRTVRSLDDVRLIVVPSSRMMSDYNFTEGFVPKANARQIQMMLIHPSSVVTANKHGYIKLWPPGTHTLGDGYLYQNRQYWDLWVLPRRVQGVIISAQS